MTDKELKDIIEEFSHKMSLEYTLKSNGMKVDSKMRERIVKLIDKKLRDERN